MSDKAEYNPVRGLSSALRSIRADPRSRRKRSTGYALAALLFAAGCADTIPGQAVPASSPAVDRALIVRYFDGLNAAARQGPSAQREYFRRTQHPDFADRVCDLRELTVRVEPTLSTLRPDPKWTPREAKQRPRGVIYVLAVSLSIRRGGSSIAEQIGSQRVVVLDGTAYGFTPCPADR